MQWGPLAEMSSLTCVYFAMLSIGVMYALVILVGGHDFDMGADVDIDLSGVDMGADVGADFGDGAIDMVNISPVTIAGFVTGFGSFGLISQGLFEVSAGLSLVAASVGGLLVGLVSHLAFIYFFIKPQGSSEITRADIVGATGDVITPIPSTSVGEIALVARGSRVTMTARSAAGTAIARGTVIRVQDLVGSVALVEPLAVEKPDSGPRTPESSDGEAGG